MFALTHVLFFINKFFQKSINLFFLKQLISLFEIHFFIHSPLRYSLTHSFIHLLLVKGWREHPGHGDQAHRLPELEHPRYVILTSKGHVSFILIEFSTEYGFFNLMWGGASICAERF